jgi:hypothetical protein
MNRFLQILRASARIKGSAYPRVRTVAFMLGALWGIVHSASACTELPAGTRFWIRLTTPISSHNAKPGMTVQGLLLESPACDHSGLLPMKTPVEGKVLSAHRVGLGLWHETATLEIAFTRLLPAGSTPIEIDARILHLNNAREDVKKGVIHGIRGTDTLQGTVSSRLKYMPSFHLYPDPFLLSYKMLFPVFPEPEICLDPGTDVEVELTHAAPLPSDLPIVLPTPEMTDEREMASDLAGLPERTVTTKGKEADVVNIVFAGSRDQLEQAFATAGWRQSEHVSKRTVNHQIHAFLAKTNYATAPMSKQLLDGRPADLNFEKTFDSYEKRDHLRIWSLPQTHDGEALWASAAVRETGATLSIRHKGFMHHVDPALAEEQHIVVRDLLAADCVDSVGAILRPEMDHVLMNATGEIFRTDGTLTVVRLKNCGADRQGAGFSDEPRYQPGSKAYRYVRKEILTVRSDLWRANILYAGYDLTLLTVKALRRSSLHHADVESFRQSNHPLVVPETAVSQQSSE